MEFDRRKQLVLVVSLAEAKQALIQWWADTIVNDHAAVVESLQSEQGIQSFVPNIHKLLAKDIAEIYGDLNLGGPLAKDQDVDQVVVELQDGYYVVAWDRRNVVDETGYEMETSPDVIAHLRQ